MPYLVETMSVQAMIRFTRCKHFPEDSGKPPEYVPDYGYRMPVMMVDSGRDGKRIGGLASIAPEATKIGHQSRAEIPLVGRG